MHPEKTSRSTRPGASSLTKPAFNLGLSGKGDEIGQTTRTSPGMQSLPRTGMYKSWNLIIEAKSHINTSHVFDARTASSQPPRLPPDTDNIDVHGSMAGSIMTVSHSSCPEVWHVLMNHACYTLHFAKPAMETNRG